MLCVKCQGAIPCFPPKLLLPRPHSLSPPLRLDSASAQSLLETREINFARHLLAPKLTQVVGHPLGVEEDEFVIPQPLDQGHQGNLGGVGFP